MRKITLMMAALIVAVVAMADGMTSNVAVGMSGTYKVGTTEVAPDFTSLGAAVTALNTSGVSGDVTLLITSDLTEAANIGLGVNTNGFKITIRPDVDVDRTITFTQLTDNTSPTGHFVIGYPTTGLSSSWSDANTISTNNVTINGYAEEGTTKRLKFTNTAANHVNARVISVVGGCQNINIKNCIIENKSTNSGSPVCITVLPRKGSSIDVAPSNVIVENNTLNATGSVGMGLRLTYSAATGTPTSKILGFELRNNIITAQRRLLEFNYNDGAQIYGNTFNLVQTAAPGALIYGIFGNTGIIGVINIYNNKFNQATVTESATTGNYGLRLIALASGPTAWNIYNNTFTGMNRTQTAGTATLNLSYIQVSFGTANIYNNTFYMPALTSPSAAGYYNAINNSNAQNAQKIKNNIFISDEQTANCAFVSNVCVSPGESEYNIYFHRQANVNAKIVSTYSSLSDYKTANPTKDIRSKSIDVKFTNTTTGDLSITDTSVGDPNLAVPKLSSVLTDIAGTNRAALTYAGAYEASDLTAVAKQFTVSVPAGTSKVYVAGGFTGKNWDIADPYSLIPTGTANQFSAILPCVDGVEYKYICEKADWDYQEAIIDGVNVNMGVNRTYNANDNVPAWYRVNKVTLNAGFAAGSAVPTTLFVKGAFNAWASPIEMTKSGSTFSTVIGGNAGDKIAPNTEYKYYTNDEVADNWESLADGSFMGNRWMIAPVMTDEVARFTTWLSTEVNGVETTARIMRTNSGIEIALDGLSTIELYTLNGIMIDKMITTGAYVRDLANGIYIVRINGKATKFIK